ncbi:hypothetical protein JCM3766R1_002837 [Sporobolomyces carnicolor]
MTTTKKFAWTRSSWWCQSLALAAFWSLGKAQSNNSSAALVCTPAQCLLGDTSLAAGIVATSRLNSSTRDRGHITLLPGTYTRATFASLSSSFSNSTALVSPFSTDSIVDPPSSNAFTTSGSLSAASSSTFSVSLQPGLVTYSAPYYEGSSDYYPPSSATNSSTAANASDGRTFSSVLLTFPLPSTSSLYAIVSIGTERVVVWESIPEIGALGIASSSTPAQLVELVDDSCRSTTRGGCSNAGGVCSGGANQTCVCRPGWTGPRCSACLPGHFGPNCEPCRIDDGCTKCDEGLTGTGVCLDRTEMASTLIFPSICDCVNGICSGNSTTSKCACNAGWTSAANGTQCAACAPGYYLDGSGDCLACDPTCAQCSSPAGSCQTCRDGLQAVSSSRTACVASTQATRNGTFVTCPASSYFSSDDDACIDCDPTCSSCYKAGSDACLSCKSPNVLLEGKCVAIDQRTGVCDAGGSSSGTSAAGWVFDNEKKVCDSLPSKCTKGGIDSFSSSSNRAELTCSACTAGSFLIDGDCVQECPAGMTASADGTKCEACDSACSTCAPSLSSYCTSCGPSRLLLNGTCISSSSCPTGYFPSPSSSLLPFVSNLPSASSTSNSSTTHCLACHPDCETCSPDDPTICLSCFAESSRPVLLDDSGACAGACAGPHQYYDRATRKCLPCSDECETCYGGRASQCLTCPSYSSGSDKEGRLRVQAGKCVELEYDGNDGEADACAVIEGYGVCLRELVDVTARSPTSGTESRQRRLPWWLILVIILAVLAAILGGLWWFRKKERRRRRAHTQKFADDLGKHDVDKKLAALPHSIAYPPTPRSLSTPTSTPSSPIPSTPSRTADLAKHPAMATRDDTDITARFVLEDPSSPISPRPSSIPPVGSPACQPDRNYKSRLSSSEGLPREEGKASPPRRERIFKTAAGNTLVVNSRNPFFRAGKADGV